MKFTISTLSIIQKITWILYGLIEGRLILLPTVPSSIIIDDLRQSWQNQGILKASNFIGLRQYVNSIRFNIKGEYSHID